MLATIIKSVAKSVATLKTGFKGRLGVGLLIYPYIEEERYIPLIPPITGSFLISSIGYSGK